MIYVSSSAVKADKIKDAVEALVKSGFRDIELSGGTKYYEGIEQDLLELKEKYNLNYLCHNYFPPPKTDFVLNIASLNPEISERSVSHVLEAIRLSKSLGAKIFAFHAGFLIDIPVGSIGKRIDQLPLFDREKCIEQFCRNYELIRKHCDGIRLYIENNVLSAENYLSFGKTNPFFMCDLAGIKEFSEKIRFNHLLDLAHLHVSCQSLGLDFSKEASELIAATDYIHVSDNDGTADTNQGLRENSPVHKALRVSSLTEKIVTLEVYSGLEELHQSYRMIQYLVSNA